MDKTRKTPDQQKIEQLALDMETFVFLREKNTNSVFAAIGLADPDTGKIVHIINWTFPIHQ